ncbi:aminodeoxychorismate synthase component I [Herminiimonas sp. CN]|uniref:aminodeoxychorismate synthase component I n=1 Tax=Herminiimonas sp. CN TaxID=1349818 RepID=UPI0004735A91|nr:aminodeoxychorismate synthase component I [Herminiimonas sp. CN]
MPHLLDTTSGNGPGSASAVFALLDDCDASAVEPRSRLYTGYVDTLSCGDSRVLPSVLARLEQALQCGLHAVGLFSYELGAELMATAQHPVDQPLVQILLFTSCQQLSAEQVQTWLAEQGDSQSDSTHDHACNAGIANIQANISESQFAQAITRIRAYIAAGDIYQANYTYRLHFDAFGSLHALYLRLRRRQPVPYGALIGLPDGRAVLSFSPELFVRHENGRLTACPMKGTAPASDDVRQDAANAQTLASDPKNRAENLMIVDLLRNDLGRVAALGSVAVPALFEVKRYSSVLQMTSTIRAQLRQDVTLEQLFTALYPCGSITGAPKRRAMQVIRELEPDPRGIYTGSIGWFDPIPHNSTQKIGDFCLSVPIRTLALQAPLPGGIRKGEMGVGAGIVHDSKIAEEYAECQLKARFLTGLQHAFTLFETLHATRSDGYRHLALHLQRLRASADYFGFTYQDERVRRSLEDALGKLPLDGAYRARLSLEQSGQCAVQTAPLTPLPAQVKVLIGRHRIDPADLFLRHKTTVRERYDAAWRDAEAKGAFDTLFTNIDGELTEGGRSNVFLKMQGCWHTPPLQSGVLPGVMRRVLLADPQWAASERRLTLADLRAAECVVVCNALRGAVAAAVEWRD